MTFRIFLPDVLSAKKKDCAKRLGTYPRKAIDIKGTYIKALLIGRFECSLTGKTFSLLPHQLVPYRKHALPFVIMTLRLKYVEKHRQNSILERMENLNDEGVLSLHPGNILRFEKLIEGAVDKIIRFYDHADLPKDVFYQCDKRERIRAFIEFAEGFICHKTNPPIRGPCGLGYDFYLTLGGFSQNAPFLFGTPSQFR